MNIVFNEIKKLWNLKSLAIIGMLCALFYLMFMEFSIKYFPNGHQATEDIYYSAELTRLYGPKVTDEQLTSYIASEREQLMTEAEEYISAMPIFAQAGIYSYADYERVSGQETQTQVERDAQWTLLGEECGYLQFYLQSLGWIESMYDFDGDEGRLAYLLSQARTEPEAARYREIVDTKEYANIMPGWLFNNTNDYFRMLCIMLTLAVLALLSPLIVTDRRRNVHYLQYSSKLGRKILYRQLAAVMLSAFLLTTVLLLIFGGIYSTNDTFRFWSNGITSFMNGEFLLSLTYGEYVCILIVMLYVLALFTAAAAFILSRFSRSMITLVMKLVPAFAALVILYQCVLVRLFGSYNRLYLITHMLGTEPVFCGVLAAVGLTGALWVAHREKRVDVA